MRTFLIALMIALLPLRGWVGDVMAEQMALPSMKVAAPVGAPHAHCAMHDASADTTQAQDGSAQQHHEACSACQACHTLALEAVLSTVTLPAPVHIVTPFLAFTFASADRALSVKPPIV
jgi:cytochrome c553